MIELKKIGEIVNFLNSLSEEEKQVLAHIEFKEQQVKGKRKPYAILSMGQEKEIQDLIALGNSAKQISALMGVAYPTILRRTKKGKV